MKNEKKYYRAIYRKLPLRRTEKKQYLSGLLASLNEYVAEKPEITYQELVDTFGTPDSVVAGILNVSVDETRRMAQNKRKLYVLLMVAMLAVCLILCFFLFKKHEIKMIYVQSEITEYESWPFDELKVDKTTTKIGSKTYTYSAKTGEVLWKYTVYGKLY